MSVHRKYFHLGNIVSQMDLAVDVVLQADEIRADTMA